MEAGDIVRVETVTSAAGCKLPFELFASLGARANERQAVLRWALKFNNLLPILQKRHEDPMLTPCTALLQVSQPLRIPGPMQVGWGAGPELLRDGRDLLEPASIARELGKIHDLSSRLSHAFVPESVCFVRNR